MDLFVVTHRHVQSSEKFVLMRTFPVEGDLGDGWPSFRSPTINVVAFFFLWSTCAKFSFFFFFLVLFIGDFTV